jgi:hypothetical protein
MPVVAAVANTPPSPVAKTDDNATATPTRLTQIPIDIVPPIPTRECPQHRA